MRKTNFMFASLLICLFISLSILCSCGGNMTGWPTLDLKLDVENYDEISLEYHHASSPSDRRPLDKEIRFYGNSFDKEVINSVYLSINGLPYSKKTYNKIDTEEYVDKVVIQFLQNGETMYVFTFYAYGVTNGYFVFDNGEIHQYRGDFVGRTYERFKDQFNQEEKDDSTDEVIIGGENGRVNASYRFDNYTDYKEFYEVFVNY